VKVILAGSRTITDPFLTDLVIARAGWTPTEIVSGCAAGVDTLGEQFACRHGIPVKRFPANWTKYGSFAGPERNGRMARYADALALVWDGSSKGSANMLQQAREHILPVQQIIPVGDPGWNCSVYRWLSEGGYLRQLHEAHTEWAQCL